MQPDKARFTGALWSRPVTNSFLLCLSCEKCVLRQLTSWRGEANPLKVILFPSVLVVDLFFWLSFRTILKGWLWWRRKGTKMRANRSQRWFMRLTATGRTVAVSLTPRSSSYRWVLGTETMSYFHHMSSFLWHPSFPQLESGLNGV